MELSAKWRKETGMHSMFQSQVLHPAYQRIIGMGAPAIPYILEELQSRGGHWLWALSSITGQNPAPKNSSFKEAKAAWLNWGIENGYIFG